MKCNYKYKSITKEEVKFYFRNISLRIMERKIYTIQLPSQFLIILR
jgi:hypothetical protein